MTTQYVEEKILSKRFILALAVLGAYLYSPDTVPLEAVAAAMGYYFITHSPEPEHIREGT